MTGDSRTPESRDDYETPQWLVERIRGVLGGQIELDPATTMRNPTQALRYHTEFGGEHQGMYVSGDGLSAPWIDGTYINPPFGQALRHWAAKAIFEDVRWAMLTPARFGSGWFRKLSRVTSCVLVLDRRLKFTLGGEYILDRAGKPVGAQFDSCLHFRNLPASQVREVLGDVGTVWSPYP